MRVIAGKSRSLKLKTPTGLNTRPTQDRIKETLFNMIQNDIPGAVFIDCFAGSGGIGIEALSRGAKKAYFIENNKEALFCIEDNLKTTHLYNDAVILKSDIIAGLSSIREEEVNVIFMDPPYEAGYEESVFKTLLKSGYVTDDTLIILEASLNKEFSFDGFLIVKEKKYKTNKHIFLRRNNEESNLSGKL